MVKRSIMKDTQSQTLNALMIITACALSTLSALSAIAQEKPSIIEVDIELHELPSDPTIDRSAVLLLKTHIDIGKYENTPCGKFKRYWVRIHNETSKTEQLKVVVKAYTPTGWALTYQSELKFSVPANRIIIAPVRIPIHMDENHNKNYLVDYSMYTHDGSPLGGAAHWEYTMSN